MSLPYRQHETCSRALVAFDTTSAKSNLALIAFVEDYLEGHGIAVHARALARRHQGRSVRHHRPEGHGGIGLSGHSDCVPVEGQHWTSDPFTLTERDGKLYGRGSCDMKGFIACVLASVPLFKSRKLKEPIHIIISYDEEVGCTGVRPLIARLGQDLPRPRAVIVGEPTGMAVIDAHKRIDAYRTRVTGREAHSSMPELGVNAIAAAAALDRRARAHRRRHRGEAERRALRAALLDRDGRHHRRRHGAQHRAQDLRVSMAGAQPASGRARRRAARPRRLRQDRAVAAHAAGDARRRRSRPRPKGRSRPSSRRRARRRWRSRSS